MTGGDEEGHLRTRAEGSHGHSRPATSYYDLYPERKRPGPYVPKHTLIALDKDSLKENAPSRSNHSRIRRSPSGSQLSTLSQHAAGVMRVKHIRPSLQSSKSSDRTHDRPEPAPNTHASPLLGHLRPRTRTMVQEPVRSIEEIVRTHSSSLLTVPSWPTGPQRSASWSTFDHRASPQRPTQSTVPRQEPLSDSDSISSEDSVKRETRDMLQSAQHGHLERSMSKLSVVTSHASQDRKRPVDRRPGTSRTPSPVSLSPSESHLHSSSPQKRSLTCCAIITIPGTPGLQVSFADVGDEKGRTVIIFLGLGASRHLVGLYDELAASFGLRLICIDRWGIGRTDAVTLDSRTILRWSLIVAQVADLLGIAKFSMLAHSAGAPFAAAVALLFPDRIQGPVHLLAPWAGIQQDSGYRWLRYVPDGFIKTAQAAEFRLQNWRLGREGSRANSKTPTNESDEKSSADRPSNRSDKERTTNMSSRGNIRQQKAASRRAMDSDRHSLSGNGGSLSSEEAEREGALALLDASRTESARGLVDDLSLVLGKRPWGFDYTDVQVRCEIWHGSQDERIALSSSVNLSKEMPNCSLHIIDGASHNLMTTTSVVVEVFESIRKHSSL